MFDIAVTQALAPRWQALPKAVRRELERQLRVAANLVGMREYLEDRYGKVVTLEYEAEYAIDTLNRKLEVFELRAL